MHNVLIIGYGSIGRKHAIILAKIKKIKKIYIITKQKIQKIKKIQKTTYTEIVNLKIDYIIISNPSSSHYKTIKLIEKNFINKKVLIEKPLFNKSHRLDLKKNFYYVGYNLRFHPVIKKIKNLIIKKNIWNVEINQQSYLPDWRKNIPYERSCTAKKSSGGGILLELSHELDLVLNIFGNLKPLFVLNTKKSNLKINTDDILIITGTINSKGNKIIFNLSSNIFSKNLKREIKINGENFSLFGDLVNNKIFYSINNKKTKIRFSKFDIDRTYLEQHQAILKNDSSIICSYNDGNTVMNLIDKIKKIKFRLN